MSNLNKFVTVECQNDHDLHGKKNYSAPKIYNTDGDLYKRLHVCLCYQNPQTANSNGGN